MNLKQLHSLIPYLFNQYSTFCLQSYRFSTQSYFLLKKTKSKLESETHIVDKEDPSVLSQCIGGNGKGRLKPFIKKH